ncbi:hypothetical protein NGA_2064400, partial [Nannochloropsis gaditana CCMP526]|uniref:uncharacterized protein n=1 Tax=Nannochloropsis gaditana (strain CCMP526) TaxID=1093141 RepID=UPI00029F6DBB
TKTTLSFPSHLLLLRLAQLHPQQRFHSPRVRPSPCLLHRLPDKELHHLLLFSFLVLPSLPCTPGVPHHVPRHPDQHSLVAHLSPPSRRHNLP